MVEIIFQGVQSIDIKVLTALREVLSASWLDRPMLFVSALGDKGLLWILLTICFLFMGCKSRQWRGRGILLFLSLGVNTILCNGILKPLVARTRPYDLLGYEILVQRLSDFSFPSGHTSASFAAAAALFYMNKRWGIAAYVFATLMGISRIYLGVHFPSDVLAGAFFGWLAAKIVIYVLTGWHCQK